MIVDKQIVTIVEHLLIIDTDDGTVLLNQRCPKTKMLSENDIKNEQDSDDK